MYAKRITRRSLVKGAVGLAGVSALSQVVSCTQPAPTTAPTTVATAAAPASTAVPTAMPTSTPAIKYANEACIFRFVQGGPTQPEADDQLLLSFYEDQLREKYGLNVKFKFECASWQDIDQLMELRLQTQATDGVQRHVEKVQKWIDTPGLIRDIDDAVKEYGKNLLELIPQAGFQFFMREDRKYIALPMIGITPGDVEFYTIRRDWLDKIDRDVPTTIEELEEDLRLFKKKGLGGDLTIPFTPSNPQWYYNGNANLAGPFAPEPEEQFRRLAKGESIELRYVITMNEERLELLRRWHQDGLVNPEWSSWQFDQVKSAINKGNVGCVEGGWWDINFSVPDWEKADPTQDWVQIHPPLGLKGRPNSGRIHAYLGNWVNRALVVASWAKCPEAIVALCDWSNASLENYLTCEHGIQGKHWKWGENGSIVNLQDPNNPVLSGMATPTTYAPKWNIKKWMLPQPPGEEWLDPTYFADVIFRNPNTRTQTTIPEKGEYPVIVAIDHWVPKRYPQSAQYKADMDTLCDETVVKIIKGELSIREGVKGFWDRWMQIGGEVRIKEIADQVNAYFAAHPELKDPQIYCASSYWNTTPHRRPRKNT